MAGFNFLFFYSFQGVYYFIIWRSQNMLTGFTFMIRKTSEPCNKNVSVLVCARALKARQEICLVTDHLIAMRALLSIKYLNQKSAAEL